MGEGRAYAEACARHGLAPLEAVLQVLHGGSPTDLEVKQLVSRLISVTANMLHVCESLIPGC